MGPEHISTDIWEESISKHLYWFYCTVTFGNQTCFDYFSIVIINIQREKLEQVLFTFPGPFPFLCPWIPIGITIICETLVELTIHRLRHMALWHEPFFHSHRNSVGIMDLGEGSDSFHISLVRSTHDRPDSSEFRIHMCLWSGSP